MEAEYAFDTLTPTYKTTRCHNPEDYNMNFHSHENIEPCTSNELSVNITYPLDAFVNNISP
jgi:hypothetical protein